MPCQDDGAGLLVCRQSRNSVVRVQLRQEAAEIIAFQGKAPAPEAGVPAEGGDAMLPGGLSIMHRVCEFLSDARFVHLGLP